MKILVVIAITLTLAGCAVQQGGAYKKIGSEQPPTIGQPSQSGPQPAAPAAQ